MNHFRSQNVKCQTVTRILNLEAIRSIGKQCSGLALGGTLSDLLTIDINRNWYCFFYQSVDYARGGNSNYSQ